ncbi:hypothetical protein EJ02DRAFT_425435 [Clathrospora elynae]|uniref:Uncharacterized protein n=1 Tax=Clathrospora elynae TaxID=706981 RepID=A0A6A5SDS5_9PLEO|nr:hypothetical protein EJ02DRAFT_425435 [Clathrospora elynae]
MPDENPYRLIGDTMREFSTNGLTSGTSGTLGGTQLNQLSYPAPHDTPNLHLDQNLRQSWHAAQNYPHVPLHHPEGPASPMPGSGPFRSPLNIHTPLTPQRTQISKPSTPKISSPLTGGSNPPYFDNPFAPRDDLFRNYALSLPYNLQSSSSGSSPYQGHSFIPGTAYDMAQAGISATGYTNSSWFPHSAMEFTNSSTPSRQKYEAPFPVTGGNPYQDPGNAYGTAHAGMGATGYTNSDPFPHSAIHPTNLSGPSGHHYNASISGNDGAPYQDPRNAYGMTHAGMSATDYTNSDPFPHSVIHPTNPSGPSGLQYDAFISGIGRGTYYNKSFISGNTYGVPQAGMGITEYTNSEPFPQPAISQETPLNLPRQDYEALMGKRMGVDPNWKLPAYNPYPTPLPKRRIWRPIPGVYGIPRQPKERAKYVKLIVDAFNNGNDLVTATGWPDRFEDSAKVYAVAKRIISTAVRLHEDGIKDRAFTCDVGHPFDRLSTFTERMFWMADLLSYFKENASMAMDNSELVEEWLVKIWSTLSEKPSREWMKTAEANTSRLERISGMPFEDIPVSRPTTEERERWQNQLDAESNDSQDNWAPLRLSVFRGYTEISVQGRGKDKMTNPPNEDPEMSGSGHHDNVRLERINPESSNLFSRPRGHALKLGPSQPMGPPSKIVPSISSSGSAANATPFSAQTYDQEDPLEWSVCVRL